MVILVLRRNDGKLGGYIIPEDLSIPGTGLVPWKEFFKNLKKIGYRGPLVIEAFDPGFEELNRLSATLRKFAATGEELAIKGQENLKKIEDEL